MFLSLPQFLRDHSTTQFIFSVLLDEFLAKMIYPNHWDIDSLKLLYRLRKMGTTCYFFMELCKIEGERGAKLNTFVVPGKEALVFYGFFCSSRKGSLDLPLQVNKAIIS